jgi:hypothetical protein
LTSRKRADSRQVGARRARCAATRQAVEQYLRSARPPITLLQFSQRRSTATGMASSVFLLLRTLAKKMGERRRIERATFAEDAARRLVRVASCIVVRYP